MRLDQEWQVAYEHPEYGTAIVTFRWVQKGYGFAVEPVAVEFDLLTPVSVQDTLTAQLVAPGLVIEQDS